jgi:hypothetical protein
VTEPRIVTVDEVLAAARRILSGPYEAAHVSIADREALAAFAIQADRMIRGAGLSYPRHPEPPPEAP